MKFFATILSVIGVSALLSSAAVVPQDENEIVDAIKAITSASAALNETISDFTPTNFLFNGYVCSDTALLRRPQGADLMVAENRPRPGRHRDSGHTVQQPIRSRRGKS